MKVLTSCPHEPGAEVFVKHPPDMFMLNVAMVDSYKKTQPCKRDVHIVSLFFCFVLQIDVIHQEVFYYQTMKIYPAILTIYDFFLFWTDVPLKKTFGQLKTST